MRRWLPWLGAVNALVVLVNLTMASYSALAHRPAATFASLAAAAIGEAAILYLIHTYRRAKPSSPSQQPTSSTSPNPNQLPSLTPSQIVWRSLSVRSWNPNSSRPGGLTTAMVMPWNSVGSVIGSGAWVSFGNDPLPDPIVEQRIVPVIGFRMWAAVGTVKLGVGRTIQLASMNTNFGTWAPGVNEARCLANGTAHTIPNPLCTCGYYVLSDLDQVPWQVSGPMEAVVGAVVGWGRVVQHGDEGWRAQKVQIIALLDCKISAEQLATTQAAAETYGVPVVGRKALELLAAEYGERLPLKQLK